MEWPKNKLDPVRSMELVKKTNLDYLLTLAFNSKEIDENIRDLNSSSKDDKKDEKFVSEQLTVSKIDSSPDKTKGSKKPSKIGAKKSAKSVYKIDDKLVKQIRDKLKDQEKAKINALKRRSSNKLRTTSSLDSLKEVNNDSSYFVRHLIGLVNNNVGIKGHDPPFSCHPDLIRKYLSQKHNVNYSEYDKCSNAIPLLKFLVFDANISTDKGELYDPYFKVYLPGSKFNRPYKSRHIENDANPKWNELFYLKVTRKEIAKRRNVKIEIWDRDPSTVIGAIKDFKTVTNTRRLYKVVKDFFEVLFSGLFNITIDDKIGECWINLDDVSVNEVKITKTILDRNLVDKGKIRMCLDWGFIKPSNRNSKMLTILMHMKLYLFCLNQHLNLEQKNSIKELKIEKINYMLLFYISELALINQNRIKGSLTSYEDAIIRRSIMIRLLIKLPDRILRLLLCSMLVNEDLNATGSLIWLNSTYLSELQEFEIENLNQLIQFYTTRFDAFKCLCFSKEFDCETLDILQFLRVIVIYEKIYPKAGFDLKVNTELRNYIISLIESLLSDQQQWSALINKLDFLDENLGKYWQRCIKKILDKESLGKIRSNYEKVVYEQVKAKVQEWRSLKEHKDENALRAVDYQLIKWYFFCKNFEMILFSSIKEPTTFKISKINQIDELEEKIIDKVKSVKSIKSLKDANLKVKKEKKAKQSQTKPVVMEKSIKERSLININEQLPKSQTSILSIDERSKSNLELNQEKQSLKSEKSIDINTLTFGDLVENKPMKLDLVNVFPKELFSSWMNDRVNGCLKQVDRLVDKEIKDLIKIINKLEKRELMKSNYTTVESYFYEVLSETIYFFTSLQYWDQKLFEITIDKFCECINEYVKSYKTNIITNYKTMKKRKGNLLVSIGINELTRLNDKLLNRTLIQMLTDLPSEEVWNCIDKHGAKADSKDLASLPKMVVRMCLRIRDALNKNSNLVSELVNLLGKQTLLEFYSDLNQTITSKDSKLMFKVVDQLETTILTFSNNLVDLQNIVDLIVFLKHNINLNLKNAFLKLIDQYKEEEENEQPEYHLTKIKIIKLVNVFQKVKDFFKIKIDSFNERIHKSLIENRSSLYDFYIESDEFFDLMKDIINFKVY